MTKTKIEREQKQLAIMIALAATNHVDQFDRGGKPYILHTITVMHKVKSDDLEVKQMAVGHDLIEDTTVTLAKLKELGFSQRVLDGLYLLTHDDDVSYQAYIDSIATNEDAIRVKLADLRHNSDFTRMKGCSEKDFARMQKYQKAYAQLVKALTTIEDVKKLLCSVE